MDHEIQDFSKRMYAMRRLKRMSLRKLQKEMNIDISHTMLSRYEKGEAVPSEVVRSCLCQVLDIGQVTNRCHNFSLSDVHFRKRCAFSQKEQCAIVAQAEEYFACYFDLESLTKSETSFKIHVSSSGQDMEALADALRQEWSLGAGPVANLSFLLEVKGIKIYEVNSDNTSFDGFTSFYMGEPLLCIASWLNHNIPRKRMTLAHELGHAVLAHVSGDAKIENHESAATYFAGAFLQPANSFCEAFGRKKRDCVHLHELVELKEYFGTSIKAIMVRAAQMHLIDQEQLKRFYRFYSKQGYMHHEPGVYNFPEHSERYVRLIDQALAKGLMDEAKVQSYLRYVKRESCFLNMNVLG